MTQLQVKDHIFQRAIPRLAQELREALVITGVGCTGLLRGYPLSSLRSWGSNCSRFLWSWSTMPWSSAPIQQYSRSRPFVHLLGFLLTFRLGLLYHVRVVRGQIQKVSSVEGL